MVIGLIVGIVFIAGVLYFQHRNKDQQSRGKKWILRGLAVLGILCALGAALVFGLSGYVVLSTRQQFRT